MHNFERSLSILFILIFIPYVAHAQKSSKPDEAIIVNEAANPVPVDIIDKDTPIAVSGQVSLSGPVEVNGIVDAYILNRAPGPDDFVVLSTTTQEVAGTKCGGSSRPLLRRFGKSSQNNRRFIVPVGKQLVMTDFSWTANLRDPPLNFAAAVTGGINTTGGNGSSTYWAPFKIISEGDFVSSGSEQFKTGLVAREGAEVCVFASFIRLSDGSGPFTAPLGDLGLSGKTTIQGYLVDE